MVATAPADDCQRLIERGPGIATLLSPMRFLGLPMGRRCVLVRGKDSCLLINPPRLAAEALRAISEWGTVTDLVVPTGFHDTFLADNVEQFPEARFLLCPRLLPAFERILRRHDHSPAYAELTAERIAGITPDLVAVPIDGMPLVAETVFVHRPSSSLIVSDLLFRITPEFGFASRIFARLGGIAEQPGPSLLERLMIRDKASFRSSLERLLEHRFERILPSHFACVPEGGREVIERVRASIRAAS